MAAAAAEVEAGHPGKIDRVFVGCSLSMIKQYVSSLKAGCDQRTLLCVEEVDFGKTL